MTAIQRDQAATIRAATSDILLAANTIAGTRVQQERVDEIAAGDTPRLIVFADQTAQSESQAGTAPTFTITLNLIVQALVEQARLDDAVAALDTLIYQVKQALLANPAFTILTQNIASMRIVTSFKSAGEVILGDARILLTCTWRETYNPSPSVPFAGLGVTAQIGNAPTLTAAFTP